MPGQPGRQPVTAVPWRREQVERVKAARKDYVEAQSGTREDRARAAAVLNRLLDTSTPEEIDQGYEEHWLS